MKRRKDMKSPSENTLKLLLDYEVGGGQAYYEKKGLNFFTWPGGYSGPTIGIGIDCAYYKKQELADMFKFLQEDEIKLIQGAVGCFGEKGKLYTKTLRMAGIAVSWDRALELFEEYTWPKYATAMEKIYPGVENLCEDAYGALASLIFNRGTSLSGASRKEMLTIRELIKKMDYRGISKQLKLMERLWVGKGLDGLIERRRAEAKLIQSCI